LATSGTAQRRFDSVVAEIVIAKHSSQASPLGTGLIALTGRFVSEVRKALS
jgi:hypothetical protein